MDASSDQLKPANDDSFPILTPIGRSNLVGLFTLLLLVDRRTNPGHYSDLKT